MTAAQAAVGQEKVKSEAIELSERAKSVLVKDQAGYTAACEMVKTIKTMRKQVDEVFNPIIEQAHKAHKVACDQKKLVDAPLLQAETALKSQIGTWTEEQERLRKQEENRLRLEAQRVAEETERKRLEDERIQQAIEAESAGNKKEAEEIMAAPAPVVENVYVPPVVVPTSVQQTAGVSSRDRWCYEVTDFAALVKAVAEGKVPITALEPNDKFLGQQARSLKNLMSYPGVKAFNQPSVAVRA